ncbi:hypothetical protein [Pseudoalteromonas sp. A601]|uniref:hypothetical protein n=1 Tax=Pseudoalteromonas sp. A601 TaxID=1967839 RepID=UPI001C3C8332|nr:hypothetical protein [Pseudoalteromonas sp. A601]
MTLSNLLCQKCCNKKDYITAAIGKWYLDWGWSYIRKQDAPLGAAPNNFDWHKAIENGPTAHGFDYSFGDNVINFPPYVWIKNNRVTQIPDTMVPYGKIKKEKCVIERAQ